MPSVPGQWADALCGAGGLPPRSRRERSFPLLGSGGRSSGKSSWAAPIHHRPGAPAFPTWPPAPSTDRLFHLPHRGPSPIPPPQGSGNTRSDTVPTLLPFVLPACGTVLGSFSGFSLPTDSCSARTARFSFSPVHSGTEVLPPHRSRQHPPEDTLPHSRRLGAGASRSAPALHKIPHPADFPAPSGVPRLWSGCGCIRRLPQCPIFS